MPKGTTQQQGPKPLTAEADALLVAIVNNPMILLSVLNGTVKSAKDFKTAWGSTINVPVAATTNSVMASIINTMLQDA